MEKEVYDIMYALEETHWWYRVRRSLVIRLLRRWLPSSSSDQSGRMLDIGCGTGNLLKELQDSLPGWTCDGIDISPHAVAYCRDRGISGVMVGDLYTIPHADETFDAVLCLDVLEHVEDDQRALAEMRRVLKPGGLLILFVPAFMSMWGDHDVVAHHYRRYRSPELHSKVRAGTFAILQDSYFNCFLFVPIFLFRRFVRLFHMKGSYERSMNTSGPVNRLLYGIFRLESVLLKYVRLPFGVSYMIVCKKI